MATDNAPDDKIAVSPDRRLTIGAFASRSHLSPKALRLYDRLGLLEPAEVDPQSGYRRYRECQLETARLIVRLRQLDMPLAMVGQIVTLPESDRGAALSAWWDDVEMRIAVQRDLLTYLLIRLAGEERNFDMFTIEKRDIPEQLVVTEQRHITAGDLQMWLGESIGRQLEVASQYGGAVGPLFVIYHGEVTEESDGPVEVCVPIDPGQRADITAPSRIEPAHREAFTRIARSMVGYPQILAAYDAVDQWISGNDKVSMAGSPREVYFTDMMAAGPDDPACDIAFPVTF